jgi:hypothetical protein
MRSTLFDLAKSEHFGGARCGRSELGLQFPALLSNPLYVVSYAMFTEADNATGAYLTPSFFDPFEDRDNLYTPFHHLVLLNAALFERLRDERINASPNSPLDDATLSRLQQGEQLSQQISNLVRSTAESNPAAAEHMRAAYAVVPKPECR